MLEGADVDEAVDITTVAKVRNDSGSACAADNRLYVHESFVVPFTERLGTALATLRIGPGIDRSNHFGTMVSRGERDKIEHLLAKAEAQGVARGNRTGPWYFLCPGSLVTGVQHGTTLTRTEIFVPAASVIAFRDTDDAITMANDVPFGLISYVVAGNPGIEIRVAQRLEAGMAR